MLFKVLTAYGQLTLSAKVVVVDWLCDEEPRQKTAPRNFDEYITNGDWQRIAPQYLSGNRTAIMLS